MKIAFHRKTFVFLGRLESMNQREASKKVQELGGYVSSTPRPSSDYIVLGKKPGKKFALVEKVGKPTLTEAEFLAAVKAVESGREEGQDDVAINDAVAGLRDLLFDAPSRQTWAELSSLLDACAPDQLELAVDYVEQHIAQWPSGDEHPGAPLPIAFEEPPAEQRVLSVAWRYMALAGERSPRLRLGRSLSLSGIELRGDDGARVLDHPDLLNIRALDTGDKAWPAATFFEDLRRSKHLPQLRSLALRNLRPDCSEALCGEHEMANLRNVTVVRGLSTGFGVGNDGVYDRLMEATWWEQIESLVCATSGTYGYSRSTLYPHLARHADRLGALRSLVLEDSYLIERLLETDLVRRMRRLSLSCSVEAVELVFEHLARHRLEHTIETLELSRIVFVGGWGRPKKYAKVPQKAAVEHLMRHTDWGALREVIVEPSLLGARLKKKLDAWGETAGITINTSPWTT